MQRWLRLLKCNHVQCTFMACIRAYSVQWDLVRPNIFSCESWLDTAQTTGGCLQNPDWCQSGRCDQLRTASTDRRNSQVWVCEVSYSHFACKILVSGFVADTVYQSSVTQDLKWVLGVGVYMYSRWQAGRCRTGSTSVGWRVSLLWDHNQPWLT